MRVLLILILLLIVVWWARRALVSPRRRARPTRKKVAERVLACEHCGVHVPESDGVRSEVGFYCSNEHRRLGPGGK